MIKRKSVICQLKFVRENLYGSGRDNCNCSRCCYSALVHTSRDLMSSFTLSTLSSTLSSFPLHLLFLGLIFWQTFLFSLLTGNQYYIIQFSVIPLTRWDIFEQILLGLVFQLPDAWQSKVMRMPCKILKFDWTAAQTGLLQQQSYPPLWELLAVRHPSICCYLCFHPRWIKNKWGREMITN